MIGVRLEPIFFWLPRWNSVKYFGEISEIQEPTDNDKDNTTATKTTTTNHTKHTNTSPPPPPPQYRSKTDQIPNSKKSGGRPVNFSLKEREEGEGRKIYSAHTSLRPKSMARSFPSTDLTKFSLLTSPCTTPLWRSASTTAPFSSLVYEGSGTQRVVARCWCAWCGWLLLSLLLLCCLCRCQLVPEFHLFHQNTSPSFTRWKIKLFHQNTSPSFTWWKILHSKKPSQK